MEKSKFSVVKTKNGYAVKYNGKILASTFRLKVDAITHTNNLKKVADSIHKKGKINEIS